MLLFSGAANAIESYEHWGLGIAPIFSVPISSDFKKTTDTGLGSRLYYRKNMRVYTAEIGLDFVQYAGIETKTFSPFALGMYRFAYMESMDYSIGFGGGMKQVSSLDSLRSSNQNKNNVCIPFLRFKTMVELDVKSNQTVSASVEYDITQTKKTESLQDLKIVVGYTYYFGFYNLGSLEGTH